MGKVAVHTGGGGGGEKPFVVGTYTGDSQQNKFISVGFTPSAVLLYSEDGNQYERGETHTVIYGGLALDGHPCRVSAISGAAISVCAGGFMVYIGYGNTTVSTNSNRIYHYIAFR